MSVPDNEDQDAELTAIVADTAEAVFADLTTAGHADAAEGRSADDWFAQGWAKLAEAGLVQAMRPEDEGGVGTRIAMQIVRLSGAAALALPLAEAMAADWLLARTGKPPAEAPMVFLPQSVVFANTGDRIAIRARVEQVAWARHCHVACIGMFEGAAHLVQLDPSRFVTERRENLAGEPRDTVVIDTSVVRAEIAPLPGADETTPRRLGALLRSAQLAGAAHRVVLMTAQYASERAQFGRTLSRFQAVQQLIAVMAGESAAAGVAAELAAKAWSVGCPLEIAATAKIRTGDAAGKIAAAAHQIHGAIGFTREHSLQLLTRRLWSWRDEFGDEAVWSAELGRALARDRRPLWHAITDFSA